MSAFLPADGLQIHGVAFHQAVGALAGDTQHGRGPRHVAAGGAQGGQQRGQFHRLGGRARGFRAGAGFAGGRGTPRLGGGQPDARGKVVGAQQGISGMKHHKLAHQLHQFAHIEGPVVHAQALHQIALDGWRPPLGPFAQQVRKQMGNILFALA